MSKLYKCIYCKEDIEPQDLVEFMTPKGKQLKRSHYKCRRKAELKQEFYDYLLKEVLDIPKIEDKRTFFVVDNLAKDYSWTVMIHALKTKEEPIRENFTKGWQYIMAILKNQLPISHTELKRQKQLEKEKEKMKKQQEEVKQNEIKDIKVYTHKRKPTKQVIEVEDLSTL